MFESFSKFVHLLTRRERIRGSVIVAASALGALLEMVGVGAIPAFVAALTDPASIRAASWAAPVLDAFGVTSDLELVRFLGIALLVIFVTKNVFLAGLVWVSQRFVFRLQVSLADRLFSAYLTSPYTFHLQRNSSELLRNTNNDATGIVTWALVPMLQILLESLTLAAILALLLVVEPVTSVAAFLVLGGTTLLFLRLVRARLTRLGGKERVHREEMIRAVTEGLGGIKVTKILGRESHFLRQYRDAAGGFADAGIVRAFLAELPRLILETIAVGGLLGVALFLLLSGRTMESLVPTLTLLAVAVVRMIPSFNRIMSSQTSIRWGEAALKGVYEDLVGLEAARIADDSPDPTFERSIRLDSVDFTYPEASGPTLVDVSLEVPRGTAVGLVGPTGSGKTTLVDVILGLLTPTGGRVLVDGVDIRGHERGWQRHVGYIPQEIYLSDASIRRNIAFGVPPEAIDDQAVWKAVDAAQVREFVARLPEGLDTVVGERGVRLSGGQRQRIGIARALYHDPDVLVMDEATSALDNETERYVMEAIEHLKGSRTLILIAHRLSTVESCDRLYLLRDGRVEAEGSFEELQGASAHFRRLSGQGA